MRDHLFLLLLYGCHVADISGREPQRIMRIVERLNMTLDDQHKLRLLGNFDPTRGYFGLPLATSHPELARGLQLPLMSAYFTVTLDAVAAWLLDLDSTDAALSGTTGRTGTTIPTESDQVNVITINWCVRFGYWQYLSVCKRSMCRI